MRKKNSKVSVDKTTLLYPFKHCKCTQLYYIQYKLIDSIFYPHFPPPPLVEFGVFRIMSLKNPQKRINVHKPKYVLKIVLS